MPVGGPGADLCLAEMTLDHYGFKTTSTWGKTPTLCVKAAICSERDTHSAINSFQGLRNFPKY